MNLNQLLEPGVTQLHGRYKVTHLNGTSSSLEINGEQGKKKRKDKDKRQEKENEKKRRKNKLANGTGVTQLHGR